MKKEDFNNDWFFYRESGERRALNLPHDAMIEERRMPDSPGGSASGYFPGGLYFYEKTFYVPQDWADKTAVFQFEGVYRNAKVFINDKEAGGKPYGYIPFFVNTEGFLRYGEENAIRVVADNSRLPNSRWYSGSGIYRPVWLWLGHKTHIDIEGIKISTLSYSSARIKIEVRHTGGDVETEILCNGERIADGRGDALTIDIPNANLWSDETPNLYQCRVTISENGVIVDEAVQTFGIRLVEWSNKGLFINGRETLLRGGCVHHDNGILGARSYAESEERRVKILKRAGFNAIRSAHNPAASAMLEACDKYGIYVMDETWDMWYLHKNKYDYASDFTENYKADIETILRRDFNHPSVIMYSLGNEVTEPHEEKGIALIKEMAEYARSIDKTRAVTCGVNLALIFMASIGKGVYKEGDVSIVEKKIARKPIGSTMFNFITWVIGTGMNKFANLKNADRVTSPCLDVLDIAGYNYASGRYPLEGKAHPNRIVIGTETFPQEIAKNWAMVKKYPYLIGDFMWTAWDYLGEAGVGAWAYTDDGRAFSKPYPWLLAETGAVDILGNLGAEAEYAAVVWGLRDKPFIGVRPVNHAKVKPAKSVWRGTNAVASWSWRGCEEHKAIMEVYSDAHAVELQLNSKRIDSIKKTKNCKAIFKTKYRPGTLTAIAFDVNGKELSRSSLISASGKTSIGVQPEKHNAKPGEIIYVDINLTGENGVVECNADAKLDITVENGELLAFGSANPRTEESYLSGSFTTHYGRAQAVVRAKNVGTLTIMAEGKDLETASACVTVK
jgi:hypothetical protein